MMSLRYFIATMAGLYLIFASVAPASANTLVADLSLEEVAITTDFNGETLLLFGAVGDARDGDIIVEFNGQVLKIASRKKKQLSGIWINRQTVNWKNAPSFYHLYSTRPIDEILACQPERPFYQLSNLGLKPRLRLPENELAGWIEALNRNMIDRGLWQRHDGGGINRGVLFRTPVSLPANILPGITMCASCISAMAGWWRKTAPLFRWPSAARGRLFIRLPMNIQFLRAICDCICGGAGWVAAASKNLKKQRCFLSAKIYSGIIKRLKRKSAFYRLKDLGKMSSTETKFLLVLVDDSEELHQALHYACKRASAADMRIALLYVIAPAEFAHWAGVGELMRQEAREYAEEKCAAMPIMCKI